MNSTLLKLDWCSHEAAKFAVENWHYSRMMPHAKLAKIAKIGVYEDGKFIGCVIFGSGATRQFGTRYGLTQFQICELVRIALREHQAPVTRIVAIALKLLKGAFPKLRMVISFADPEQDHVGAIYQAGNWTYTGMTTPSPEFIFKGRRWHGRAFNKHLTPFQIAGCKSNFDKARKLDPSTTQIEGSSKHRYLMPLDEEMKKQIAPLALAYPKKSNADVVKSITLGHPPRIAGSRPSRPLQLVNG